MNIYVIRSVQPIHIIVNNGHVTLEGMVRNQNTRTSPELTPIASLMSSR